MVWQVLDDVVDGRSWDFICNVRWGGRIPLAAVGEAVKLTEAAWLGERNHPARSLARKLRTRRCVKGLTHLTDYLKLSP